MEKHEDTLNSIKGSTVTVGFPAKSVRLYHVPKSCLKESVCRIHLSHLPLQAFEKILSMIIIIDFSISSIKEIHIALMSVVKNLFNTELPNESAPPKFNKSLF